MATGSGRVNIPSWTLERQHPNNAPKNPKQKYPQGCPRGRENECPEQKDYLETTLANGQWTTSAVYKCGEVCKNLTGLKIHQTKIKTKMG